MMIPNVRTLVIALGVLVVLIIGGAIAGGRAIGKWKSDAATWQTRYEGAIPKLEEALARGDNALAVLAVTDSMLARTTARADTQRLEILRLRQRRESVVIVPSVPGQAPTCGDTLAAFRLQLSICSEESKLALERGDMLSDSLTSARRELGNARADVFDLTGQFQIAQQLLVQARPIIAAADPPCYLWKAGPVRVNCLGRKDGAALAIAGTLLVTAPYAKNEDVRRYQRYVAGGLVIGSVVIW